MTAEALFSLANALALVGWVLLIATPRWRLGTHLVAPVLIPVTIGLLYLYLAIAYLAAADGGFGSLAEVGRLFENTWVLLAGWVHYLAFDLFVGSWEVRDAQRLGVHHVAVVPCLLLTLLLGPIGLMAYLVVRGATKRRLELDA